MKTTACLLLLLGFFSVQSRSAMAGDCIEPKRAAELFGQYSFEAWNSSLNGSKGDWEKKSDLPLCDSSALSHKVMKALLYLEDLPALSNTEGQFEFDILGDRPIRFFKERVHSIYLEPEPSSACDSFVVAFVRSGTTDKSLHVCPYANTFSSQTMAEVLLHEARHIEGYPHTGCSHGLFSIAGGFACDKSYEEKGAYGVGVEFNVKLSRTESIDPSTREEARGKAVSDLLERFNTLPLNLKRGALLFSTDGDLSFFDGSESTNFAKDIAANAHVIFYKGLPAFLDAQSGSFLGYIPPGTLHSMEGMLPTAFSALPPSQREKVLDIYAGNYSCFLYSTQLQCELDGKTVDLPLPPGFVASNFIRLGDGMGLDIVLISSANGKNLLQLPPKESFQEWSTASLENTAVSATFRDLAVISSDQHLAILTDGRLVEYKNLGDGWNLVPGKENQRFKRFLSPFYWSKTIEGL